MKRLFTTIGLVAMIIIAGCTDLDDVQRQIDELKARLKSVEQLTSNANSEITSIRALIDAVNKKLSVVSYKELADKSGYELTLSDGGKITLKHGAKGDDGITPEINVKQHSDGLLYWTINGNFLFDSNGNKVVAQGFTPQLRVNSEFHWEMSLDGGTTWQLVKDDKGNSVLAQGPKGDDGDADLTITEVGDVIIITYKGVTYTLPKGEAPVMMILTTAKNVGEKIELWIDAADEDQPHVWIDLNNNGIKESGEAVYFGDYRAYTIGTQTVTIYGKITWLECSDNDLKVLDVSNNTSLTWLDCSDNDLKVLDVSNNTSLTWLNCSDNNLKLLDVSNNTSLTELYCYNNQLPALNVGNNAALTSLGCNGNLLTELDVSHNAALEDLFCSNNQLQKLSVIENIKLRMLFCNNNQLTALDVSNNPNLCNLRCYNNKISGDNMTALVNSLPTLTADDGGSFRVIDLTNPEEQNMCTVTQVGIATGKNWKVLNSDGDPYGGSGAPPPGHYMTLTTAKNVGEKIELWIDAAPADRADVWIDLNNNGNKDNGEAVTTFGSYVQYTLGAQTVTIYGKVTELRCSSNNLTSLDVRHNTALTILFCFFNQLTSLDVSKNTALTHLFCYGNQLTSLDVSKNTALTQLLCHDNQLTSLDVSKNTALTELFCYGNQLTSLDVSENTALTRLICAFNPLKALDVSHNTALTHLFCHDNQLTSLDVSENTALTDLDCSNNQLTALDVSHNTALTDLDCSNNQLTALDVSHNTALTELKCFLNKISGDNMTALVNNLPIRTAGDEGIFRVIALGNPDEHNVCTITQVGIATGKNWKVLNSDGDPYPGS